MWRTIRDLRQQFADLKRINCEKNEKLDRLLAAIKRKRRHVPVDEPTASVNLAPSRHKDQDYGS